MSPVAVIPGGLVVGDGARITTRQCEVLELLAAGATNEEIAGALGLSAQTVKHHVSRVMRMLDLPNRAALAAWWAEVDTCLHHGQGEWSGGESSEDG